LASRMIGMGRVGRWLALLVIVVVPSLVGGAGVAC